MPGEQWGILGGGFGIYGYIPALAQRSISRIVVLEKHIDVINKREELKQYRSLIETASTREEIIKESNSLIISVPPLIQEKYLACMGANNYKYLVLEKPLAATPNEACKILEKSISLSESMRIGYSFSNTRWGNELINLGGFNKKGNVEITWHFYAHYLNADRFSWKGNHNEGGGSLRFYGIQLIALLGMVTGLVATHSSIVVDKFARPYLWRGEFINSQGGKIIINLNCCNKLEKFEIKINSKDDIKRIKLKGPFSNEMEINGADNRVGILSKILETLGNDNKYHYKLYTDINNLWSAVEKITEYENIN